MDWAPSFNLDLFLWLADLQAAFDVGHVTLFVPLQTI